jgi:A/G-specific adenine glycosylase
VTASGDDRALIEALLGWFDGAWRRLPWRDGPDAAVSPWAVLVSELMLQQTRVDTVVPKWHAWMARFPDVEALAAASVDDALALWTGLGYYRRARNLHRAAQLVVERHGGQIPAELDALRALPGVGAYTAGAVRSIGFGLPAAAVDGNVVRVLARLGAERGDVSLAAVRARLDARAHALAHAPTASARPAAWTQALMELGALVCTPTRPGCAACPLAAHCPVAGAAEGIPVKPPRSKPRPVRASALLVHDGQRVLLARRGPTGRWAGLWEPLTSEREGAGSLPLRPPALDGVAAPEAPTGGTIEHVLTHRRYRVAPFEVRVDPERLDALARSAVPAPYVAMRVVALRAAAAPDAGTSKLAMRLVAAVGAGQPQQAALALGDGGDRPLPSADAAATIEQPGADRAPDEPR